jgi:hypothetical protein
LTDDLPFFLLSAVFPVLKNGFFSHSSFFLTDIFTGSSQSSSSIGSASRQALNFYNMVVVYDVRWIIFAFG